MKAGRIAVLDGRRGIAILLVIVFHGCETLPAALHSTGLGRISYSLYVWQQLFLSPGNHSILGRFPLYAVAILCAVASYYVVERPFFKPAPVGLATLLPQRNVKRLRLERTSAHPQAGA